MMSGGASVAKGRSMRKLLIIAGSLAAVASVGSLRAMQAPTPSASFPALPAGAGRDTMIRVCASCHTPEIVAQQRLTPSGWKELVEAMANNGAVATDAQLVEITAYLSSAFPEKGSAAADGIVDAK